MSIIERLSNLFGIPLTMLGTGLAISLFGLDKLGIVTPVAMIYFIIGVFLEGVALIWIVTIVTHFWKNRNLVIKNKKGYKPSQKILQTDSRNKLSRQLIKNMALSIVMGVVIGTLLLYIYIFLILYQKSLISLYPILVLFFFTIIAISAFKNEEFRKHWWKYAAIFLSFMLTIQVVWPIFLPKVSVLDNEIRFGSIRTINNTRRDFVSSRVELEIKPPLIPIDRDVTIPLSPSNLTDVWYENIQPFLVSHVNKDKNSAKLYGFGDGWTYEKINVKLGYRGDTFPLHNAWISDIQSPFWKYVTNTGRVQYIVPIYLNNLENFQVCFQDYVFTIPDDIYRSQYSDLIKERVTNYSVFICDQTLNATQIVWQRCGPWIHSSTNSLNFSNVLNYEFLNSPQIALKTNSECVDANSTRDNSYLVFEPLIQ